MRVLVKRVRTGTHAWKKSTGSKTGRIYKSSSSKLNETTVARALSNVSSRNWALLIHFNRVEQECNLPDE